jgi:hypothetical protein
MKDTLIKRLRYLFYYGLGCFSSYIYNNEPLFGIPDVYYYIIIAALIIYEGVRQLKIMINKQRIKKLRRSTETANCD